VCFKIAKRKYNIIKKLMDFEDLTYFEKKCINKFLDLNGRASRAEFWDFLLFILIVIIILLIIAFIFFQNWISSSASSYVFSGFFIISMLTVSIRRMHDTGHEAFWALIPVINLLLTFAEGDKGNNKYGPDPRIEDEKWTKNHIKNKLGIQTDDEEEINMISEAQPAEEIKHKGIIKSIKSLLKQDFSNCWVCQGRLSKHGYWDFIIHLFLCDVIIFMLAICTSMFRSNIIIYAVFLMIVPFFLYRMAAFIPLTTKSVQRLHDLGHSGSWLILILLPVPILFCMLCFASGNVGCNQYGPDPTIKEREARAKHLQKLMSASE
jgi:uncharacterized membrane protein YhaH (DUF805 family)